MSKPPLSPNPMLQCFHHDTIHFLQNFFRGLKLPSLLEDCEPLPCKPMEAPSAAYIACESRGFPCRVENACGAAGEVGKNPNVGDWVAPA